MQTADDAVVDGIHKFDSASAAHDNHRFADRKRIGVRDFHGNKSGQGRLQQRQIGSGIPADDLRCKILRQRRIKVNPNFISVCLPLRILSKVVVLDV